MRISPVVRCCEGLIRSDHIRESAQRTLKIAQRFIAGIECELNRESAKRTTELDLSRPFHGLAINDTPSARSARPPIAQRFIAGNEGRNIRESAKRTTDSTMSAVRFTDVHNQTRDAPPIIGDYLLDRSGDL